VDSLAAALIEALPSDHPTLSELRRILKADGNGSLSDHIARNKRSIRTVLRLTARSDGWTDQELGQLTSLSSNEVDIDVARAAFDDLILLGYVRGLVDTFDAIMRAPSDTPDELTIRALRGFTRASHLARDRAGLFARERTGWLLDRLSTEGLCDASMQDRDVYHGETEALAYSGDREFEGHCLLVRTAQPNRREQRYGLRLYQSSARCLSHYCGVNRDGTDFVCPESWTAH
jgi:hypothetical protein